MASPIRLMRRSTRKHPGRAQVTLQTTASTMAQKVISSMSLFLVGVPASAGRGRRRPAEAGTPTRRPRNGRLADRLDRMTALPPQFVLQLLDQLGRQQAVDR